VEVANALHDRTLEALEVGASSPAKTRYFLEFPEDLGRHKTGRPASLWQRPDLKSFAEKTQGTCVAHFT
jgi:hypothetical protein